jgi:hypothetical protein
MLYLLYVRGVVSNHEDAFELSIFES